NYEMSPSRDLVESYLMADAGFYSNQAGYQTHTFVEQFQKRDPRLSQTFAFPGWELINVSNYSSGNRNYVQQLNKNFTGYHQIKGFVNSTNQDVVNGLDIPVMRYAEVLLNYAEAQAELGSITQSVLDISVNKLRQRVNMPSLQMGVSLDPQQAAKFPGVSNPLILEIRRERRVELALEGRRLEDLNRWKAGKLMEKEPVGLYFPSLGKYDLTGDGVVDLVLLGASESIPNPAAREVNSLGTTLIY
ncbi:MAG: RagB/SusD family nutrient uptake outer membrane protein, partial [Spirosomaceae bacterium]|nr:RagB/SusD family nutrient uptake outer membrane protein [Spirosomataceae bacterium]